jgi:hypothetical protein
MSVHARDEEKTSPNKKTRCNGVNHNSNSNGNYSFHRSNAEIKAEGLSNKFLFHHWSFWIGNRLMIKGEKTNNVKNNK